MNCPGAGQPPRSLYKAISHYRLRNNRPHFSTGWGECSHCRGAYTVRPLKTGAAAVWRHKPISECTEKEQKLNLRRKERWLIYYNMNHISGLPTGVFGGQVGTYFNVVETPGVRTTATLTRETYWHPNQQVFRVELGSNTQNTSGQWVFQVNDQIYVNNTNRMTMAVDYASWNAWNQTVTVSNYARIEGCNTWTQWVQPYQGVLQGNSVVAVNAFGAAGVRPPAYTRPIEDPAVRAERERQQAEALFQRVQAENVARAEAQKTAHETLLSLLTPEQREEYQVRKHFHVRGSKGTLYRILHGSSGNVRQVLSEADEGRGLHAYCAHPAMRVAADAEAGVVGGTLPHEDAMIAQMLHLMMDEDAFLAVANRHW